MIRLNVRDFTTARVLATRTAASRIVRDFKSSPNGVSVSIVHERQFEVDFERIEIVSPSFLDQLINELILSRESSAHVDSILIYNYPESIAKHANLIARGHGLQNESNTSNHILLTKAPVGSP